MDTKHSTAKIPKPRYAASNLRKAMKLESNPAGYKTMTESLRQLAQKTLDLSKPWYTQQAMPRTRYLAKAVKCAPILELYEGAWPAEVYVRQYLSAASSRLIVNAKSRSTTIKMSPKPSPESRVSPLVDGPNLNNDSGALPGDDVTTLFTTLQALRPPMGHIAGLLEKSGLATRADLMGFGEWRESDQQSFLEKDVRIKPFQAKQLIIALNSLH